VFYCARSDPVDQPLTRVWVRQASPRDILASTFDANLLVSMQLSTDFL
jgi:hypothetical protein